MIWLDLAKAYGSVAHHLMQKTMENFWFPEELKNILMQYYNRFCMQFSTDKFTMEWQRLEAGIATECTISKFSLYWLWR